MSGAAARTSRTTRARPTATRMNTPRIRPQPPTGTVGGCERTPSWKQGPSWGPLEGSGTPWRGPSDARGRQGGRELHGAAAQPAPLPLREAAPDAEALVVGQRVLQALRLDLAPGADLLGLPGRAALLGEEGLRVGLCAQRPLLPGLPVGLQADAQQPDQALARQAVSRAVSHALAGARPQAVCRPLRRTDVIAQPRHLGHDGASPLALAPVRGSRDDPGPLSTR